MRADRLLSILLLLQTRGRMTATALAERLEVSERTIYRDLDALSAAGVPVYADRGPGGGCALRSGYRTDLTGLNAGEVASLFAGTSGRQLRDLGLGAGFDAAMAKLEAVLPGERRAEAERVRARVHVDPIPWFAPRESVQHLPALRRAVLADRCVRLVYRGADGRKVARTAQPLGLVVKGGVWYLVALTRGQMRVYRVSRLAAVALAKGVVVRPKGFSLAAYWERWASEFVRGIPEYAVKLRVEREAVSILPQVFGERVRAALEAAGPPTARGLVLDYTFDSLEAATGGILGMGTLVEALEPPELRQAVRDRARAVLRRYGG